MKKYHLKKKYKIIFTLLLIIIIGIISYFYISYRLSNEYKLLEAGYKENDVAYILKYDEKFQNKLIELGYDENIVDLMHEKYFIEKNLDRYLSYQKKTRTEDISLSKVVAMVNINRDRDYYENPIKADTTKGLTMLVNKYYYLDSTYVPDNVLKASSWYAYDNIEAAKISYDAFIKMFNAAKKDGITLIINSGYRSYKSQQEVFTDFENNYGEEYALDYAAKPGFSEHQTGLGLDIVSLGVSGEEFDKTDAFKWLDKNAHKYGFILRFPKGKEDYTGFKYESWHYRYVGVQTATKIKKENITFEEYYAYYIENKK